ncbi:U3 snoRNP-associated protein Lcp5 [Schizosaccharomyces japonicus yFS275]|uniref:U3 snoRNP-associated protein Lcp5 n=1 Tax=Schizosaccharomyces japonicus (strain yFS275 / FY16936) TaxID=402676 RepID=B6JV87_SCHJY|nr:U3 snoRNP-associated protein Lcp5 [Schizosaccharomyces japonicus yFS275]EEB05288.1 U3 snoRNP-associated protein Lcp5 [Schizosaccharomyces japonicus yFS275]
MDVVKSSLQAAKEALPNEIPSLKDGVSLFSLKSELLLSYIEKLGFLMLAKLDNRSLEEFEPVVESLVRTRLEMEKIRPFENRMQYSINKLLQASERQQEVERLMENENVNEEDETVKLQFKPNLDNITDSENESEDEEGASGDKNGDGVYRPPRIHAVSMDSEKKQRYRPNAVVDEFVSSDLSSLPQSLPSVGANLERRGRVIHADEKDLQRMRERTEYEESNYTRLPKLSKKELKKVRKTKKQDYGGEDWSILDRKFRDEGLDSRRLDLSSRAKKRSDMESDMSNVDVSGMGKVGDAFRKRRKTLKRR